MYIYDVYLVTDAMVLFKHDWNPREYTMYKHETDNKTCNCCIDNEFLYNRVCRVLVL